MNLITKKQVQALIASIRKARQAADKLSEAIGGLEVHGRPLVIPNLDAAYREALYIKKFSNIEQRKPPKVRTRRRQLRSPIQRERIN